jgi:hypothetical protein
MRTSRAMDEDFEYFLENIGPAIDRRDASESQVSRYRGRLPDQLLHYWQEHGWCGYAEGLFWTVDPQEYEPALEAWLGGTAFMEQDAYHLIARSAFGDLYFWGERSGHSLTLSAPGAIAAPRESRLTGEKTPLGVRTFFSGMTRQDNDFNDLFAPTLKKLGPLKHDQMYGFVPALALGGAATLDHLQKVKAVEHLVLLAQLSELRVLNPPPR